MRNADKPPTTTSLPRAPRDDESSRVRWYLITMGIRIACFVLMAFVQPYGWYTWVFAAGAIFLPYIAVVVANAGSASFEPKAEVPEDSRALAATAPPPSIPATPGVIRIAESPPQGARPSTPTDDAR